MDTRKQSEQQPADEEDNTVTITDLEQVAPLGESKHVRLIALLLKWQYSTYRRGWQLTCTGSSLLLLIVLLSVITGSPSAIIESFRRLYALSASPMHSGSGLPVLPQWDGIICLKDAAWSPNSQFIAVLGYAQNCSSVAPVPGLVNLYDAQSGKLLIQLHPDEAIMQALKVTSASVSDPASRIPQQKHVGGNGFVISYLHIIWSPDMQRLATTFQVTTPSLDGVMLMNRDGTRTQVLLALHTPLAPSSAEWDLQQGKLINSTVFPLPPALAYHWALHGTVVPGRSLSTQFLPVAPPLIPIGNPDGDPSFTLWQPALAQLNRFTDPSGTYSTHSWTTSFAAWSPDGRYLINSISFFGLLDSPKLISAGSMSSQENNTGFERATSRCAALPQAARTTLAFAWNPNRRVLAVYSTQKQIDLYDCTTVHRLPSFLLQSKYPAPSPDTVALRWSPDGSHLLLSNVASGLVTLWRFDPTHA